MTNEPELTRAQVEANARFAIACDALTAAQNKYRIERTPRSLLTLREAEDAARRAMWADPVHTLAPVTSHIDLSESKAAPLG